jgi:hypothetical protein
MIFIIGAYIRTACTPTDWNNNMNALAQVGLVIAIIVLGMAFTWSLAVPLKRYLDKYRPQKDDHENQD